MAEICKILAGDFGQRVLLTTSTEIGIDSLIEAVVKTRTKKLNITRIGASHKTETNDDVSFDKQLKQQLVLQLDYKKLKREIKAILAKMDIVKKALGRAEGKGK